MVFDKLKNALRRPRTAEDDVKPDGALTRSRETGGGARDDEDSASTTGTGTSEGFVGRVSGQDAGDDRESGAEARARQLDGLCPGGGRHRSRVAAAAARLTACQT